MTLIDRVRNICVSPTTEWPVIAQERADPAQVVVSYLAPLAAVGAVASFIGSTLLSLILPFGMFGGFFSGLIGACISFLAIIISCYLFALVINLLAPYFGGRPDYPEAFKTAVYANTPGLAAGILFVIPVLGGLVALVAALYGLYVLYLGLPVMMRVPREKAPLYLVAILVVLIVVWFVFIMFAGVLGAGLLMFR